MKRKRKGFTLIETVVAMTMFAVVTLGMAKMATAVALRGRNNDIIAKRNAALQLEANKFGAVRFSALANWSTADRTLSRGNFTYTRKLVITGTGMTRYTVKILVIPTADPTKRDSVIIERSLPPGSSPLCLGC